MSVSTVDVLGPLLLAFEQAHPEPADLGRHLRHAIDSSPDLKMRMIHAVEQKTLKGFTLVAEDLAAGGAYEATTGNIQLCRQTLLGAGPDGEDTGELIFALGHEINHALYDRVNARAARHFDLAVRAIAERPDRPHDYTGALRTFLDHRSNDEAIAHIGGFNALRSYIFDKNSDATLDDLYNACPHRIGDFVGIEDERCKLKPGLSPNADLTLPETPGNIAAMGDYYYRKPGDLARLGAERNLDYPHHDANALLSIVLAVERIMQPTRPATERSHLFPAVDLEALGLERGSIRTAQEFELPACASHASGETEQKRGKRELEYGEGGIEEKTQGAPKYRMTAEAGEIRDSGNAARSGFPDEVHPLFDAAFEALKAEEKSLPLDEVALRDIAAAIALAAHKKGWTHIAGMYVNDGGPIIALRCSPSNGDQDEIRIAPRDIEANSAVDSLAEMGARESVDAPERPRGRGI